MINHLGTWMPTYIAEVERQSSLDPRSLPAIRSFTTRNEFTKWPEDQLPAVVVVSPGAAGEGIRKEGDGRYRVRWVVGVAVVASARDQATTNRLAKLYIAAARAAILQHASLGGFAEGVEWEDERYNDLPPAQERTLSAAQDIFTVEVRDVLTAGSGPVDPVEDPYDVPEAWPSVEAVTITVNQEED